MCNKTYNITCSTVLEQNGIALSINSLKFKKMKIYQVKNIVQNISTDMLKCFY